MASLENKKIMIINKESSYSELIKECSNTVPQQGFTIDEMKKRLRIHSACTDAETLQFEHADAEKVKELVKTMRWGVFSEKIIEFCGDIENMENK